jgi:hypothetical protein
MNEWPNQGANMPSCSTFPASVTLAKAVLRRLLTPHPPEHLSPNQLKPEHKKHYNQSMIESYLLILVQSYSALF